jgi:hypothetical protein
MELENILKLLTIIVISLFVTALLIVSGYSKQLILFYVFCSILGFLIGRYIL